MAALKGGRQTLTMTWDGIGKEGLASAQWLRAELAWDDGKCLLASEFGVKRGEILSNLWQSSQMPPSQQQAFQGQVWATRRR